MVQCTCAKNIQHSSFTSDKVSLLNVLICITLLRRDPVNGKTGNTDHRNTGHSCISEGINPVKSQFEAQAGITR